MIAWQPLLAKWSRELMKTDLATRVDPPPESEEWLGFSPAGQRDIQKLERRLGVILPPSYKSFLLATNGWRRTTPFIARIRPAREVDWFRVENENWVEVYSEVGSNLNDEEYYDYSELAACDHRAEHLASLLQISDVDDGVYLLNPMAVTPDGEWEAWFFANWVPGARRYPSFAHLMINEYRSFARLEKVEADNYRLPELVTFVSNVPRVPAERNPSAIRAKAPSLDELIEGMWSPDDKVRAKAVRTICGKFQGRTAAKRRIDLVPKLVDLFYASSDASVRSTCVTAITEFAGEDDPPRPLIDALSDSDPGVVLSGIFALTYFPDARALEPLCRFIDSRVNALFNENAMQKLGEMGDEKAVRTLAGILLDVNNELDQSFGTAAIALAQCGEAGFNVLVSALDHSDARIRRAAVVGIDVSGDPRAAQILEACKSNPDPSVRERARVRVGGFMFKRPRSN